MLVIDASALKESAEPPEREQAIEKPTTIHIKTWAIG
jgi:hypothetical protein